MSRRTLQQLYTVPVAALDPLPGIEGPSPGHKACYSVVTVGARLLKAACPQLAHQMANTMCEGQECEEKHMA